MNGGMEFPPGFRFMQPRGIRGAKNLARGLANALPRPIDAKRQAECLIVANQRTEDALPSNVRGQIFRMVENGVVPELWARGLAGGLAESTRNSSEPPRLVAAYRQNPRCSQGMHIRPPTELPAGRAEVL